ncbi:2'-5' RNA ligase family protein [Hymenobacter nivis]|uniref:Phosphoesterase HXTX n=1 Tax=Hymenobacter nivis TaxID=1850093 RepID=A0A2Z3GH06_9BACT|nr:2'-5' RNA ligase family protein [Hymenobacter nivis]AWM32913.1 phosphoesterase HXTX [Hymenobacter nivis]
MSLPAPAPLILTLALDAESQAYFDELRRQHFPPKINYLAAHVTLFHHLPGEDEARLKTELADACRALGALPMQVASLRSLGRGVAFNLENAELRALHRRLQTAWGPRLTPQDQQKLQPHITVQNKVDPTAACQLLAGLQADFQPFAATGTGLKLWAYRGGPWELRAEFAFAG